MKKSQTFKHFSRNLLPRESTMTPDSCSLISSFYQRYIILEWYMKIINEEGPFQFSLNILTLNINSTINMQILVIKMKSHRYKVTWNRSLSFSDDKVYMRRATSKRKNFIIVVMVKNIVLASIC